MHGAAIFINDKQNTSLDTSNLLLIEEVDKFKVYRGDASDAGKYHYFVRDERYNETFAIDAVADDNAIVYGKQFYDENPRRRSLVEKFRAEQKDLIDRGLVQMPDGKHGVVVPGLEKMVDGVKVHTEVRYTELEKGKGFIVMWEIDENGKEVRYNTLYESFSGYEKYFKIAKGIK